MKLFGLGGKRHADGGKPRGSYKKPNPEEDLKKKLHELALQKAEGDPEFAGRLMEKFLGLPATEPAADSQADRPVSLEEVEVEVIAEDLHKDPDFRQQVKEAHLERIKGRRDRFGDLAELAEAVGTIRDLGRELDPGSRSATSELADIVKAAFEALPALVQYLPYLAQASGRREATNSVALPQGQVPEPSVQTEGLPAPEPEGPSGQEGWEALAGKLLRLLDKPAEEAASRALAILDGEGALDNPLARAGYEFLATTPQEFTALLAPFQNHPQLGPQVQRLLTAEGQEWLGRFLAAAKEMTAETQAQEGQESHG